MKKRYLIILLTSCAIALFAKETNYQTTVKDGKEYYIYKVQKSEGYYAISKKFNVSIKDIMDANPTEENSLKLGQKLYIPVKDTSKDTSKDTNKDNSKDAKKETTAQDVKHNSSKTIGNINHTIAKGDTFYNLSKRYGITVNDLRQANPGVDILSIGQNLVIPDQAVNIVTEQASEKNKDFPKEAKSEIKDIVAEAFDTISSQFADTIYERNVETSVRIAVLMPFGNSGAADERFTDFYRGCLIAADSLKELGLNITIDAYNIGKTKESIYNILQNKDLSKANIIIGPAYTAQIPYVAYYAKLHGIKLIVPFANNVKEIENNNQVFQIVCQQTSLYNSVADKCTESWNGKKVIIVRPDSAGILYNKKEFTDILMPKLSAAEIPYRYISDENIAHAINTITAADSSEYVVVIPTTNNVKLTQLADHFDAIKGNRVSIFGFPEWNDMLHKDLYNKPLYMFTNYYLNFQNPAVVEFYNKYYAKFGVPAQQNNPSYPIFGFDITLYFAKAYCHNGKHFEQFMSAEDSNMLQMNFQFDRIGNGGYANHGVYLQLYNKQGIN